MNININYSTEDIEQATLSVKDVLKLYAKGKKELIKEISKLPLDHLSKEQKEEIFNNLK